MGRARDISKVFSTSTSLSTDSEVSGSYLTQSSASTVYQTKAAAGLTLLTPGSITNTGGTASIGANGTVTFSGVASQSVNDVFSATYENYRIVFSDLKCAAGNPNVRFRLRVSGTDSSASYNYAGLTSPYNADNVAYIRASSDSSFYFGDLETTIVFGGAIDLYTPFLSQRTRFSGTFSGTVGGTFRMLVPAGFHDTGTSYTGFTIFPSSSNFTGKVSVYGYNL